MLRFYCPEGLGPQLPFQSIASLGRTPFDMKETCRVARNSLNTIGLRVIGYIWVQFLSPLHYPVLRVRCSLNGGGRDWPVRVSSDDGEVLWKNVPLDHYSVTLELGSRRIKVAAPWLRADERIHEQRLKNASELLGPQSSPHGIQIRLTALGYDCGAIDGNPDSPATRESVERFQQDYGLLAEPSLSIATQELLVAIYGA